MTWIASIRHFGQGDPEGAGGSTDPSPLFSDEIEGEGGGLLTVYLLIESLMMLSFSN